MPFPTAKVTLYAPPNSAFELPSDAYSKEAKSPEQNPPLKNTFYYMGG